MLGDLDRKKLRDGLADLAFPLTLLLHPHPARTRANEKLAEVVREMEVAAAGGLRVRPGDGRGLPDLPALTVDHPTGKRVAYLALPDGPEAPPFIEWLVGLAGPAPAEGPHARLAGLAQPARVQVFIASACPHCPQAVRAALSVARASPQVTLQIIDAQFFDGLAAPLGIQAVPATVIDGGTSFVGVKPAPLLADLILHRDSPAARKRLFDSLVESGRFADAAQLIVEADGLDHFLTAWKGSTTSTRLGLLLVVEQVLERERGAMDSGVEALLPSLGAEDAALRGDTADLLGQIGHPAAAGPLKALLEDVNPDVAEIAEEAIDAIMDREPAPSSDR